MGIIIILCSLELVAASVNWKSRPNSRAQEQAIEASNNILLTTSYAEVYLHDRSLRILQMNFGKQSAIAEQKRGQPNVPIALADASSTSTNVHLASDNKKHHRNNRMVLLLVKNGWTKLNINVHAFYWWALGTCLLASVLLLSKKGTGLTNSPLANSCASLRSCTDRTNLTAAAWNK